jgi:hypothetical protein
MKVIRNEYFLPFLEKYRLSYEGKVLQVLKPPCDTGVAKFTPYVATPLFQVRKHSYTRSFI